MDKDVDSSGPRIEKQEKKKKKSGDWCMVMHCSSNHETASVFRMPGPMPGHAGEAKRARFTSLQMAWINFINRNRKFEHTKVKHIFVCSRHFDDTQFDPTQLRMYRMGLRTRPPLLLPNSIPHIYNPDVMDMDVESTTSTSSTQGQGIIASTSTPSSTVLVVPSASAGSASGSTCSSDSTRKRARATYFRKKMASGSVPSGSQLSVVSKMSSVIQVPLDVQYASREERKLLHKESKLQHNKLESKRRKKLQNIVKRLGANLSMSKRAPLKKHLASAISLIKDLKYKSSVLMAERSWLILENREAGQYLHELRGTQGCKPKLWEDGRTWQDDEWDAVQMWKKSTDEMEVEGQEMEMLRLLKEMKKQKMQLHADYVAKTTNPSDAVRGETETGGWCSDRRCPAAPHRIHHGGGEEPWWMAAEEEEDGDEDGGWVEDTDKTKLDGDRCPDESLRRPRNCSRNHFVSPFTIVKEKKKQRKSKKRSVDIKSTNDRVSVPVKRKRDESKNGSDVPPHNVIKQEPVDIESTNDRVSEPVKKKKKRDESKNGSDVPPHNVIKQEPVDIESTNDRVSEPVKTKRDESKNGSDVPPHNVIKQEPVDIESTNDGVSEPVKEKKKRDESKSGSDVPAHNVVKQEPVDIESTNDRVSEPVKEKKKCDESKNGSDVPAHNVVKQEPVDIESTNDRLSVPLEKQHSESKNNFGTLAINAIKQEPMDIESTYEETASVLLQVLEDLGSINVTEKTSNNSGPDCSEVVPSGLRKLHVINVHQKDLQLAHKQLLQLGRSPGNPDHRSSDLDVHLIPLNPDKAVLVRLPRKPGDVNSASGSTGTSMVGLDQAPVTEGKQRISQGFVSSKELDSMDGKAQADADVTKSADKSSSDYSPMSCMLCDKPFDNVGELQSHLISSHAS